MSQTLNLTKDCFHFVLTFVDVISTSVPHIYISALPLSPKTSIVHDLYKQYACALVKVVQGLPISWDPFLATKYCEQGSYPEAAWSLCSRFVAVSDNPSGIIKIHDGATLEHIKIFEPPENFNHQLMQQKLGFSPDGHTLTQLGRGKLISWDFQTGSLVSIIHAGELGANSHEFTHSIDGKMLAIASKYKNPTTINTYDLISGAHKYPCHVPEGYISAPIWTHGEFLHLVTVRQGFITIWQAAFTLVHTLEMVETFPTPDEVADVTEISKNDGLLFFPALSQLALTVQDVVFVWGVQDSRILLKYKFISPGNHPADKAFSPNGHFFSCSCFTQTYIWRRSPAGYVLHQILALPSVVPYVSFSPNEESIIVCGPSTTHLWHTKEENLSLPNALNDENGEEIILAFSPNEVLAASAHTMGDTVTIFNIQSGDLQLTIDTDLRVQCLGVAENIVVVSSEEIIMWNLPVENCINARASIDDSIHTTIFCCPEFILISISPDLCHIATVVKSELSYDVQIYDTYTGGQVGVVKTGFTGSDAFLWVALDEHEVWCECWEIGEGWEITEHSNSGIAKLKPLDIIECPPQLSPYESRCGYKVTNDGWILSPTKERLMWLPHHWRSIWNFRRWSGRFLGLVHRGLPEVVILECPE